MRPTVGAEKEWTMATATCEDAAVSTETAMGQRRGEATQELWQRWEVIHKIEAQQGEAHVRADNKVLDVAKREFELTESEKLQITTLSNTDLHKRTLAARHDFLSHCARTHSFAANRLIPFCEEIIKRYKMPGVAAKDRPNKQPTVDSYFRSIGLNYNTVRTWFFREKWTERKKLNNALFKYPISRLPEMAIEGDQLRRSGPDFKKIKKLAEQIVAIGEGHNISLRSIATDLLIDASRQLVEAYGNPECDFAAALVTDQKVRKKVERRQHRKPTSDPGGLPGVSMNSQIQATQ